MEELRKKETSCSLALPPHTNDENTISLSPPPKTTEETSSSLAPPPHTTDENTISISPPTTEETGPTNLFDQRKMRACRSKVT